MPSSGRMATSCNTCGQFREVGYNQVWLIGRLPEWTFAAVNEGRPHAVGLCTGAIERMIGNEQTTRAFLANQFLGFRIGLPVRLEIAGFLHRNDVIEAKANMWT